MPAQQALACATCVKVKQTLVGLRGLHGHHRGVIRTHAVGRHSLLLACFLVSQVDPMLELLSAREQVALYAHLKGVPRELIGAEADSLVVGGGWGEGGTSCDNGQNGYGMVYLMNREPVGLKQHWQLLGYSISRSPISHPLSPGRVQERVGLPPGMARRPSGTLSGGNKRKTALALALVGSPAAVLLDEPSSGEPQSGGLTKW
jgi:hypothetical protein